MKNLFCINKDVPQNAAAFDENPYLTKRVSEGTRDLLDHALDVLNNDPTADPTPEQVAMKKRGRTLWGISIVSLLGALLLFALSGQLSGTVPTVIQFSLLTVSVVTTFIARRNETKINAAYRESMKPDFAEASERLNAAAEQAARDLGVPHGASSLEILPFNYRLANGERVRAERKNRFDNISTSAWVDDNALCLATAQELYRIPLADIRCAHRIDKDFEVDFWLKPEPPDSDLYRAYNIRSSGLLAKRCRTYYAVQIGETHELLLPCYDWPVFLSLVGDVTVSDAP